MVSIPINLAFEDLLSEAVLRKILQESGQPFTIGIRYHKGGSGYLKKMVNGFNQAARGMPYLVLTDLDQFECPAALIGEWLPQPKHPNLLLRFVDNYWQVEIAARHSPSLQRTVKVLASFQPEW